MYFKKNVFKKCIFATTRFTRTFFKSVFLPQPVSLALFLKYIFCHNPFHSHFFKV